MARNKANKKYELTFIYSYQWKKPLIPEDATEEVKKQLQEKLDQLNDLPRYVGIINLPFENIKANNAVLIGEVNKLHTRLINGKTIPADNQLVGIWKTMIGQDVIKKDRELFILKDVMYCDVNDLEDQNVILVK